MPYIKREDRLRAIVTPKTAGELNFAITTLIQGYLNDTNRTYNDYNAVIGALESAKLEMYRRQVAPYEDQKCAENGDVYVRQT